MREPTDCGQVTVPDVYSVRVMPCAITNMLREKQASGHE
jgi:hypothetical protein